jgi:hypothetical protein
MSVGLDSILAHWKSTDTHNTYQLSHIHIVTSWWWATSKLETCRGVVTQQTGDKQCIRLVSLQHITRCRTVNRTWNSTDLWSASPNSNHSHYVSVWYKIHSAYKIPIKKYLNSIGSLFMLKVRTLVPTFQMLLHVSFCISNTLIHSDTIGHVPELSHVANFGKCKHQWYSDAVWIGKVWELQTGDSHLQ